MFRDNEVWAWGFCFGIWCLTALFFGIGSSVWCCVIILLGDLGWLSENQEERQLSPSQLRVFIGPAYLKIWSCTRAYYGWKCVLSRPWSRLVFFLINKKAGFAAHGGCKQRIAIISRLSPTVVQLCAEMWCAHRSRWKGAEYCLIIPPRGWIIRATLACSLYIL